MLRRLREGDHPMTKTPKFLFQVRFPEAERRQIKSLATSQGMTYQQAMVALRPLT